MKFLLSVFLAVFISIPGICEAQQPKILISVDMEGITGVTHWEETSRTGKDYELIRRLMTHEASAAVEGALAAGATEIVVRDAHGSARNILPDLLNENAKLLRNWSGGPKSMMEGIDETFHAVVFIGYHAKAGTPDAMLEHTSTEWAPWRIADMNVKRTGRLNVISHLLSQIPYEDLTPAPLEMPDRQPQGDYQRPDWGDLVIPREYG